MTNCTTSTIRKLLRLACEDGPSARIRHSDSMFRRSMAKVASSAVNRPETDQVFADELRSFLEDPVPALFDYTAFSGACDRLGACYAVLAEGRAAPPGQHGHSQRCLC